MIGAIGALAFLLARGQATPLKPTRALAIPYGLRVILTAIPPAEWSTNRRPPNYRLKFINDSRFPIVLHAAGFWPNHSFVLLDAKGQEPPLSPKGKGFREASTVRYGDRDNDMPFVLEAGGTLSETARVDVEEMYLLQPGTYTFTIEYCERLRDPMRVKSSSVPFVYRPSPS